MISRREMLKRSSVALASLSLESSSFTLGVAPEETNLTQFVNPFIGTGGHGHTYPGATVPFGMIQVSPDSGTNGWDWCSGYNYADKVIAGFSHTHLSGTGIGDLCDILFTPTITDGKLINDLRSPFSHSQEEAQPGYYAVQLLKHNIKAELTATPRVGLHRYTFPQTSEPRHASIVIDLGHAINWDTPTETVIQIESPTVITGYRRSNGWARDQHVYFVAHFSQPIINHSLWNGLELAPSKTELRGKRVKAVLEFASNKENVVIAKVGISAVSIEGAKRNLEREVPGWDFAATRRAATEAWNKELGKVQITTQGKQQKVIFYTSLYHSLLAPTLFCDVDGAYRGGDGKVHETKAFNNYTVFSLWDTFRAEHPMLTILQPDRVDDLIQSMMAFYREHGLLPVWPLVGNETDTMIGYHSIPVIVDAYFKKLTKVNPREALEAMKKSALQDAHGLRFYKLPQPIPFAQFQEKAARKELRQVATLQESDLAPFGQLCSGYQKSLSGSSVGYHSPYPQVNSALLTRSQDGQRAIEWESEPVPVNIKGDAFSFVWLAGIDAGHGARRFDFFVNDSPWVTFNGPPTSSDRFWQKTAANGARLSFYGTHLDRSGDLFGFMFLTVPRNLLKSGQSLRFRVVGENAGSDDWYMTFEYPIKPQVRIENEYVLIEEKDTIGQVIRLNIEHVGVPTSAAISLDGLKRTTTPLVMGANTVFLSAPKVETETRINVSVELGTGTTEAIPFLLRPVKPYNYIPADQEVESVSKTLECAYDDWCIAQLAKALGQEEDYRIFSERAKFFQNLFDPATRFMRGKLADGSWKEPFSPKFSAHRQDEYTEGNAWQYSWLVPHDVQGLIELMGGKEAFVTKLDELFEQSSTIEGGSASPDISGLIGQYAHGNEPSHHIAYLYNYAGQPWKTQQRVRAITQTLYNDTPDGLCGNEDCGQMSAWYVLSAIGFYPVNPAEGIYVIGSPHFEQVSLELGSGRKFTVTAKNASSSNIYIQSATLNGMSLTRSFIKHEEITAGGKLVFEMGNKPNYQWATGLQAIPPSMTAIK